MKGSHVHPFQNERMASLPFGELTMILDATEGPGALKFEIERMLPRHK